MMAAITVFNVVGTRPNFMKIAPVIAAMKVDGRLRPILVHTGQHYDRKMSKVFFEDLGLPLPDINLSVGSGSHARQTGEVMVRFEEAVAESRPDAVVVVGDVNSTLAAALVAAKLHIPVAHVEAGLRSFDRDMPEEINRVLTDAISDYLFVTERAGVANLAAEGIAGEKVFFVGNVMIDSLLANRQRAAGSDILTRFGLCERAYVPLTLHRPSNVDNEKSLTSIMDTLSDLSDKMEVIFPVHPRTRKQLATFGMLEKARQFPRLIITDPLNYLDTICLVEKARFVITDSGGLQEETTYLRIPCLTVRPNTERPITISQGSNKLTSLETLKSDIDHILNGYSRQCTIPDLWDGNAGKRIISELIQFQADN